MRRASICALAIATTLSAAPGLARADDPPCPDPGPIYALRNDEAAIVRLLALPRPRPVRPTDRADDLMTVSRRKWHVRLANVWTPRDRHCHIGVIIAELLDDVNSEDGPGTVELETRIVPVELAREAGPPRFVIGPRLSRGDWFLNADPSAGDLDGDGIPESLSSDGEGGASSCWGTGEECYCIVPWTRLARVGSEPNAPGIPIEGGRADPAVIARANSLLDAASSEGPPQPCPTLRSNWTHWKLVGRPRFARVEGGYDVDLVVDRRECRGWLESQDDLRPCRARRRVWIHHEVRGGRVETTERPFVETVVVTDPNARLLAVPWRYYDGDPRPHRLPVTIGRREGGRERRTGRGTRGISLPPGIYLVEVSRGAQRHTYQVAIAPGDAPVRLASPEAAR